MCNFLCAIKYMKSSRVALATIFAVLNEIIDFFQLACWCASPARARVSRVRIWSSVPARQRKKSRKSRENDIVIKFFLYIRSILGVVRGYYPLVLYPLTLKRKVNGKHYQLLNCNNFSQKFNNVNKTLQLWKQQQQQQ